MDLSRDLVVIKLGGSLYDLPELGLRLQAWLTRERLSRFLIVPGGGRTADVVRQWDLDQHLGEESSHWLALRALSMNAWLLAELLPDCHVWSGPFTKLSEESNLILDAWAFMKKDDGKPGAVPHCWQATSDTIAARVATVLQARELILLKSVTLSEGMTREEAVAQGIVDPLFAQCARDASYSIRFVNLRDAQHSSARW